MTKLNQVKLSEAAAVKIIQHVGLANWKVGKTKLFLKFYHLDQLEAAMEKFYEDVVRAQHNCCSDRLPHCVDKLRERAHTHTRTQSTTHNHR